MESKISLMFISILAIVAIAALAIISEQRDFFGYSGGYEACTEVTITKEDVGKLVTSKYSYPDESSATKAGKLFFDDIYTIWLQIVDSEAQIEAKQKCKDLHPYCTLGNMGSEAKIKYPITIVLSKSNPQEEQASTESIKFLADKVNEAPSFLPKPLLVVTSTKNKKWGFGVQPSYKYEGTFYCALLA